jgi:EAL domain-containing protein (putative c-di-GMP-specific phosphodiesterase class I)
MSVNLVAEGIETREELVALREIGVRYGQGFLLALPAEPFPADPAVTL